MNHHQDTAARTCLDAAERNLMAFPQIVETLMEAGFESYAIDFRRGTATYYLPDGDSIQLSAPHVASRLAPTLDAGRLRSAILQAQQQAPGYTYAGFCKEAVSAGCAGYLVSFSGRRVVYFGRTAETHVEHFPTDKERSCAFHEWLRHMAPAEMVRRFHAFALAGLMSQA